MPLSEPQDIADLLQNARTIALVGASDRPDRASYGVMKFLQDQGYRV
ncbi:MAG TPA: CoA-binding protein, partial [Sphingomicrobium sp.]|nr:CoA-binding protein [Sphingomicrobium sp.]